ncbi:MAG: magnesium transporter [Micavibrio aeruginosavorus]|uniref:Magnesium transport protein CorA n=1 Tax=Micavibrio aeruginosavorus TaxID=349221 RepID=A0A2W5BTA9_9BACT|nr:MAG: magnesium transporter [Micavibrio aeruginosavorus]
MALQGYKVSGDKLENVADIGVEGIPEDGPVWIDLASPTAEEDKLVEDLLKISIPTKEDMQEIELSARLYDEDGADYMTMLCIAQIASDDPVKAPVTFILYKNTLVTVRYHELTAFNQYLQKAQKKNGVPLPSAHGIMADIIESVIGRIADSLEFLGGEVDNLSAQIFREKRGTIKSRTNILQSSIQVVGAKGDLLGMLRESLSSIARLVSHMSITLPEGAPRLLKSKLATVSRDVASLGDHAGFMSGKMNFLLDATLGMINLQQNQIIKIFSIAAVVFLPPTLVASIYGMNFQHMPELGARFGYPAALAAMVVSALVPILYFRRKGWL